MRVPRYQTTAKAKPTDVLKNIFLLLGRGCPGQYVFHNGSCFLVPKDTVLYKNADGKCRGQQNGRFGLVDNSYTSKMIGRWGNKRQRDKVFIGLDILTGNWTTKENVSMYSSTVYKNWEDGQPDRRTEHYIVMSVSNNSSYSDELPDSALPYICEISGNHFQKLFYELHIFL